MAYVKVTCIGLEMSNLELNQLTQRAEDASNRAFGPVSSLDHLEALCVRRDIEDSAELPRIEVEVSRPFAPGLVGRLVGLATEIADIMHPHYARVRVLLEGPGGGPQAECCLRSNYPRDQE